MATLEGQVATLEEEKKSLVNKIQAFELPLKKARESFDQLGIF